MSYTTIPEEGESGTRTWIAHSEIDPTAPIIRDSTPNKTKKSKQPKMMAEAARDEALANVQAEEMKNPIAFPKLICQCCGEDFRDGQWLYQHQTSECVEKKALDTKNEIWEARKRVFEIKYEVLDGKEAEIKRLTGEVTALKLELLEAKQKDEACGAVYAERKAETARKKAEREEREWYLHASEEVRELHYFESTGLAEVPKHSEKVKALRAAIAEQKKKKKSDRITTKE